MVYNSNYSGQRVDELLDKIDKDNVGTVDSEITEQSQNPVTSEAIFKAFKETNGKLTELD